MEAQKTHGAFSWNELMTSDPAAAAEFYGSLFGWKIQTMDMGMEYRVANVGEVPVGGLMGMPPGAPPMPPCWGSYVTVDNVDATIAKALSLGGKVLNGPMDVPAVGRMATIADPQGAVISVITYGES